MKHLRSVVGSVCAMAAVSCGSGGPEPEGYVLLDPAARQGGATVEVGDHASTSALPIAVASEERVTLHVGEKDVAISVARGELVYVQGAQAKVSHLKIGTDVAADQLRLSGEEGAARGVATQIGGTVAADGSQWRLRMGSVFAGAAFAGVPEHLEGAAPVMVGEEGQATRPPVVTAVVPASVPASVPAASAPIEERTPGVSRVSPVAFVAATGCTGVGGTWRGRVYSEPHGAYYDFTLSVRQGAGSSLRGSVVAETWVAGTEEVEPPSTCAGAGGAQHATVVEGATGTVDAQGNMRFDSQSWKVASHACGERITRYSPDRFDVPLARGASAAHAVISDDVVWTDGLPLELTRVSCR